MATAIRLEAGYDGFSNQQETWDKLYKIVMEIIKNPFAIAAEAMAFGAPNSLMGGADLIEYCNRYAAYDGTLTSTCPMTIHAEWSEREMIDEGDFVPYIFISISGNTPEQIMKYHAARAVCRLVIAAMHRANANVNMYWG